MADKMDRGLDEIIADTRGNGSRGRRGGGRGARREPRQEYPRDGVRKVEPLPMTPTRLPQPFARSFERRSEPLTWFHAMKLIADQSFRMDTRRGPAQRRRRDSPDRESRGSKLRVDNVHYDLTEEDLDELFRRIGTVARLQLRYDRAGRSEGTAYVTYELPEDAAEAVRQFDGANANGQPIRLTLLPSGPSRNAFDTAVMPSRPLSERISAPGGRARSLSPTRRYDDDEYASRKDIDRYVPGKGSRSRSPMPRRRGGDGGRRPGARRERGGRDGRDQGRDQDGGRGGRANNPRTKKTQEELDAEMADYFGGNSAPAAAAAPEPASATTAPVHVDDIDMIE
ncbi:hypothetical protein G7046_g9422 [Stylonectria norvegica]|nr:hypothetical protein G7046_g9422 [Stylonectria norvegica]